MDILRGKLGLYCLVDASVVPRKKMERVVKQMIEGGAEIIQYRDKEASNEEYFKWGKVLRDLTREKGVVFVVNDRVELARDLGADGVHVGQGDLGSFKLGEKIHESLGMKGKIVGITVSSVIEAREAEWWGADYVGISAVFETSTKEEARALGMNKVAAITEVLRIPKVAIGGIKENNLKEVMKTGVDGVAVVSEICLSKDIPGKVRKMKEMVAKLKPLAREVSRKD